MNDPHPLPTDAPEPCPFCGAAPESSSCYFAFECETCGAHGPTADSAGDEAIALWNRRTPSPVGVEPAFYTVFAKFEGAPIPLAQYSASSETGVLERVMDVARKEGYTGHPQDRMTELGWVVGPVYAAPQSLAMGRVPPNWPTNEMIEAGRKAAISHGPLLGGGQSLWHVFRDMLAASPTPPAQAADSVLEDAARWQETLMHVGAANHLGGQHFTLNTLRIRDQMFLLRGSVAQHFTACIDDSRAARKQGANHD